MNNKSTNNINWLKLRKKLGDVINSSKNIGLSDGAIESATRKIGDFLAVTVEPDSESEKLIFNLWKNASNEEKKVLTKLFLKALEV